MVDSFIPESSKDVTSKWEYTSGCMYSFLCTEYDLLKFDVSIMIRAFKFNDICMCFQSEMPILFREMSNNDLEEIGEKDMEYCQSLTDL